MPKRSSSFVSIIIPTKDEPYISQLVKQIHGNVKEAHEVIIVDKSKNLLVVGDANVIQQRTDGLGNAFLEGLAVARGDRIVLMDGDGSHRPRDIPALLRGLKTHDIALGSKFVSGGKTEDPLSRQIVSKVFALFTRMLLGSSLCDPLSGFAAFRKSVFDEVQLRPRGFKIVLEVIWKSGASVNEIPIVFEERKAGSSKAGFKLSGIKETIQLLILLAELRFRGMPKKRKDR